MRKPTLFSILCAAWCLLAAGCLDLTGDDAASSDTDKAGGVEISVLAGATVPGAGAFHEVVDPTSTEDMVNQIIAALGGRKMSKLTIYAHGRPGQVYLTSTAIMGEPSQWSDFKHLARLKPHFTSTAHVEFAACSVGFGADGNIFGANLVDLLGVPVYLPLGLQLSTRWGSPGGNTFEGDYRIFQKIGSLVYLSDMWQGSYWSLAGTHLWLDQFVDETEAGETPYFRDSDPAEIATYMLYHYREIYEQFYSHAAHDEVELANDWLNSLFLTNTTLALALGDVFRTRDLAPICRFIGGSSDELPDTVFETFALSSLRIYGSESSRQRFEADCLEGLENLRTGPRFRIVK